jgi:diguanylate cyclase (GGDEF)-like protein
VTDGPAAATRDALQPLVDQVTGAYSRALLDLRLPETLARAARAGSEFSVFLFDVDYFKTVNDSYGHRRGDEVLRQVVSRVAQYLQPGDELFRYGGDEFVVLLPHTPASDAFVVASRIVDGVQATPFPGEVPLRVSVSLGVASFPTDGTDTGELIKSADRRNYIAKRRGRGRAVADDVDVGTRNTSSRLLQRDSALMAVQAFFDRLLEDRLGALRITGERGAGHSRFLSEVSRIATLRGLEVVATSTAGSTAPTALPTGDSAGVLVVDDAADVNAVRQTLAGIAARPNPPRVTGLVYQVRGLVGEPAGLAMPLLGSVELTPWSLETVRIWLRTTLQGEPEPALVSWVSRRSSGLPARAERELRRLIEQAGLERTESGGWALAASALADPARPRYRVPAPVTELIGRETEIAEVATLIANRRLVSLTGPGGIGKTRLALAVTAAMADSFHDGAAFVPLEEATTPTLVVSAIAQALGVSETTGQPLVKAVGELLAERSLLLVLDNFEQALGAAPVVAQLLAAAPELKIIVTSRERLRVYGEQVYAVPPLPLPDLGDLPTGDDCVAVALRSYPALALFTARAQAATYGFDLTPGNLPAISQLCHQLDGLPLAIELAAARTNMLSPEEMLQSIGDRLDLLSEGPRDLPDRQQTLRAAIDWSVTMLDEREGALFASLGVFAGGCTVEAAREICAPEVDPAKPAALFAGRLMSLVEKNLLRAERDAAGAVRYRMLETIRSYALEQLAHHPDTAGVSARHAACYAAVADQAGRELSGPEQTTWIATVEADYQNIRAAMKWALETAALDSAALIGVGLWRYWRNGAHISEGREWLNRLLAAPEPVRDDVRARLLHAAALLAATQDDYGTARVLASQSLELAKDVGDAATVAQAINALGFAAMGAGDYAQAQTLFEQSLTLWHEQDNRLGMAIAYGNLTKVALCVEDIETASAHASASLTLDRSIGNTRGIVLGLECLSEIKLAQGDLAGARELLDESLPLSRELGDVFGEATALHHLGITASREGDTREAIRQITLALGLRRDVGDQEGLASSLEALAALSTGSPALAARLLGATDGLRERTRLPVPATSRANSAEALGVLRETLGESALAQAWADGRATPTGHLVDELLAVDPSAYLGAPEH